jgi:hypothetical protein
MVSSGIGSVFEHATGTLINEIGRAAVQGLAQGGLSVLQRGDFWTSFVTGAAGSAMSLGFSAEVGIETTNKVGVMVAFSAVSSGVMEAAMGGDF